MMHATVKLETGQWRGFAQKLTNETDALVTAAVNRTADQAAREAKAGNFRNQTGRLRNEITRTPVRRYVRTAAADVISPTSYAWYVEEDTRAHWIRPKEGYGFVGPLRAGQSRRAVTDIGTHRVALRWYDGGKAVFARAVYHPGTSGRHYMAHARAHAEQTLRSVLIDGWATLAARMR
jgi:hypothetical protein